MLSAYYNDHFFKSAKNSLEENIKYVTQNLTPPTAEEIDEDNRRIAALDLIYENECREEREQEIKAWQEREFYRLSTDSYSLTLTLKRYEEGIKHIPMSQLNLTREVPGPTKDEVESRATTHRKWLDGAMHETLDEQKDDLLIIKMRKLAWTALHNKKEEKKRSQQAAASQDST
jgi:hypothetical protein